MKKYIVTTNGHEIRNVESRENFCEIVFEGESIQVSDGYHTMDELYEHRIILFIVFTKIMASFGNIVWRSKKHSDGSSFDGWFILGVHKEKGKQITYHLPDSMWDEVSFAETLDLAPEWDGHTSKDILERLKML